MTRQKHNTSALGRFNLLAPSSSLAPGDSKPMGMNNRDELSDLRYVLTEPEDVFLLPSQNKDQKIYPDFIPWKKSNNSVQNVDYLQKGYMENPVVANEGGTARGSMLPLLKQWTSLPALSYFLLNSMEARDQVSRIVSPSTFRPPPRVTLTDHKRETWLRDLASPSVPLRRLSRTIPHGIKNKNLLDQCCNKQIPISRAVWFARCVGANELRGLKRRGNNSVNSAMTEALWIHDWTEEVVEYIEKTIKEFDSIVKREARDTSSNSSSWQIKIEYLTRLLAHLYHEDLLEKSLVLRWCLKSFQNSMPDTLPIALIYVKMFWQDLTSSRALSQSLALALLNQYSQLLHYNANSSAKLIIDELSSKVCTYISELFIQSPDSFVIPNHWRNLGSVLTEALKHQTLQKVWDLVGVIRMRNESLIVSDAPLVRGIRNKRSLFIRLLDSFKVPYDFEDFAKQMKSWPLDSDEILKIIFEWTVSNIRTSQPENLYICVALCKYWQTEFGWNISKSFQSFLVYQVRDVSKFCMDSIYDLIYEFLKHEILSIGGYFRSLISSGLLFLDRLKEKAEPHVLILCNLPLHEYAVEFRNQQVMLLEDLHRYDSEEGNRVENVKRMLRTRLFYLFHKHQEDSVGDQDEEFEEDDEFVYGDLNEEEIQMLTSLYKGSKVIVSEWLTQIVIEQIDQNLKFNLSKFAVLQRVFEFLRDSESLFRIIFKVIPKVNSRSLLYFLANTLKDNLKVFSTFMDLTELIQLFITQYSSLKTKSRISVGLWDLIQFTLSQLDEKSSLRPELELILKSSAASTPYPTDITSLSPVSDVTSNNNDKYNIRELELFAEFGISEPNFDSHTIPNYFETISGQFLEACKSKDDLKNGENEVKIRKLVKIFQRLRDVDLHVFNDALTKWLRDQVEPDLYYDSDAFLKILTFLVAYECLSLEKIADMFMQLKSVVRLPSPSVISTDLMLNLISSQKMNCVWLKASEKLLLDYQRRLFEKSSNCRIYLKYIVQEILEEETDNMDWANQDVLKFLAWSCNVKFDVVLSTLIEPVLQNSNALFKVKKLFRALLKSNAEDDDPKKELLDVIKVVSELNLPLCQAQFKILTSSMQISGTSNSDIAEFIVGSIHECVGLIGKVSFGDLLIHLDKALKGQILVCCEILFLQSKRFPVVCQVSNGQENLNVNIVDYLFEMIDAIADSATENIMKCHGFDLTDSLDKLVQLSENGVDDEVIKEEEQQQVQMEIDSKPIPSVKIQDVRLAILLYVKIVMIESQTFPFDSSCREKLINGLMSLLDTAVVTGSTELHGLLIDALNSIKGELVMEKSDQKTISSTAAGLQRKLTMNAVGNVSTIKSTMDTDLWSFDSNIKPSGTSYLTDLMVYDRVTDTYSEVNVRSFDLLEDANHTIAINDVPLSLAKFDCIVEKNNPD